jgi:type I restriction enzyme S subunit
VITDLEPYPAMKDSGVPWLRDVPEHWEVVPALAAYRPRQVKNTGMIETTVLSLSYGRIIVKPPERLRGLVPESFETYQVVDPGNIIVRTTDLQNDQTSLRIGHSAHRGIITSAYMCLETAPRVSNEFGYQYLNACDLLKIIYGFGSGLRQSLDFSDIKRMPVLVPPLLEQAAIVRFLDYADRRIRRYIRAKQKLIELLEEQKQAIIHRAVTRGLDPNVRLKPSGVEWLGDVPEHWRVVRAGTVCDFLSAKAHEQFVEAGGEHICVTARFVSTEGRKVRHCTKNFSPAQRGDVLMVMSDLPRGRALARTYLVNDDRSYAVNQRVCILRPIRVNPQFLAFTADRHPDLLAHDDGFNQTHLPNAAFKIMRLPLPPLAEQETIAAFLGRERFVREVTVQRADREIDLLREYRTRLIADVVTGKLDVREAALLLPDEVEEAEAIDEVGVEGDADEMSSGGDTEAGEEAEV